MHVSKKEEEGGDHLYKVLITVNLKGGKSSAKKFLSTIIDITVDIPLYVQPIRGMGVQSVDPISFGSRDCSFSIATPPMGNILLNTDEHSSLRVPIMYCIIVPRDTVFIEALFDVGDMFRQPHIQFPNGTANILQPTWTPQ